MTINTLKTDVAYRHPVPGASNDKLIQFKAKFYKKTPCYVIALLLDGLGGQVKREFDKARVHFEIKGEMVKITMLKEHMCPKVKVHLRAIEESTLL
ncbi:MAG: hypothetical protein GDA49_02820 [Rhodospirillales bacterium]|nr:hypothetical protein [Rhodospirillales bacterium]